MCYNNADARRVPAKIGFLGRTPSPGKTRMTPDEAQVQEATRIVRKRLCQAAEIGVILGSGLGAVADRLEEGRSLPYSEIPHFLVPTVPRHAGCLVSGTLGGKRLIAQQGRVHLYEGHGFDAILLPIRVMRELGVRVLVVTNAAGALNPDFRPGDLMLITDHINMTGANPLIGPSNDAVGPRFLDMAAVYDPALHALALDAAPGLGIELRQGVYLGVTGPTYETPAEVRAFRMLGADAVGMSTVHEVIYARYLGLRVLALSVIANLAAGLTEEPLSHNEITRAVAEQGARIAGLLKGVVTEL
jgi:purine-nucleoside phosphorylase